MQAFNSEQESPPRKLTNQSPEWSRVFVDGIFDGSKQILIDNQIHNGKVGYKIFTPFKFDDNQIVLIDRGWIAQGQSRSDLPQIYIAEKKSRINARRSLYALGTIKKNKKISILDIIAKRPGGGISPLHYKKLLGKRLKKKVNDEHKFTWKDFY